MPCQRHGTGDGGERVHCRLGLAVLTQTLRLTLMPCPLSVICNSLLPPSLTTTLMEVEPASRLFSSISLSAEAGRWMTSPAAILLTTCSSSFRMTGSAWVLAEVAPPWALRDWLCMVYGLFGPPTMLHPCGVV